MARTGGDAETTAAGGKAQPSNEAKQEKAGASDGNPSPCVDGHPVAIESGFVVDDDIDLALPGAIPLTVERSYSSQRSDDVGLLGKGGWVLSLEQWIAPADDVLAPRLQDGREAHFEPVGPGEQTYHRREQLELFAERGQHGPRYRLWDVRRRLWASKSGPRRRPHRASPPTPQLQTWVDYAQVVEERPFDGRILSYRYDKGERLGNVLEERSPDGTILTTAPAARRPSTTSDARGRVAWAAAHSAWGRGVEVQRDARAAAELLIAWIDSNPNAK